MNDQDRIGADAVSGNSVAIRTPDSVWSIQRYLSTKSDAAEICAAKQELGGGCGIRCEFALPQLYIRFFKTMGIELADMTTESAVVLYFAQFHWSAEKEEWDKLTAHEKQQFTYRLNAVRGRPQTGPSCKDDNRSR